MLQTELHTIHCPYCGEAIDIVIDLSIDRQEYVEDCAVCCRPMAVRAEVGEDGAVRVDAAREDDG